MANWILFGLFALIVVINAIVGLVRGLNKSVVRIMLVVLAVLLTFLIAGPVTTLVANSITVEGQSLGEMVLESVNADGSMDMFLSATPLLRELIMVTPAFVLCLVVFPVLFGVLKFLTWIAFLFAQKPLRKLIFKENRTKAEYKELPKKARLISRFSGLGVGIVTGMIVFGMIFTPVFGVFGMLPASDAINSVMDTMVKQDAMAASDADMVKEVYAMTDGGLVNFYGFFGAKATGKAYINSATAVESGGVKTTLGNELGTLLELVQTVLQSDLLAGLEDPEALGQLMGDQESMSSLLQNVFRSEVLSEAVPGMLVTAMGLPEEISGAASDVFETVRAELMKLEDEEEFNKEVDAVVALCNQITAGTQESPEESMADLFTYAEQSDVIYNTIVSISETDPFGVEIDDAATRVNMANTIAQAYAQTGKTDKDQGVAQALAKLLGVDAELNLG